MNNFRNGLVSPPGWDNISPDVKIGGFSCLKSEKYCVLSREGQRYIVLPLGRIRNILRCLWGGSETFCVTSGEDWRYIVSPLGDQRLIESNTILGEGRGNPIRVSKICNPRRGLPQCGV